MSELTKWIKTSQDTIELRDTPTNPFPRIVAIAWFNGGIEFREMCDEYYTVRMSPDDAITALREAIAWIESKTDAAAEERGE